MATTVDIEIIGVAITYQKNGDWHIIFPVDEAGCHKVNFKSRKLGEPPPPDGTPLMNSKLIAIEITAPGATSITDADNDFKKLIYNLTSTTTPPITHSKIREKNGAGKFVLMTLPNAHFFIREFANFTIPDLVEIVETGVPKIPKQKITKLAHSATARISLRDDAQVKFSAIKEDGSPYEFSTDGVSSYTLTFDNDCEDSGNTENDMNLYYEVIEEFDETGSRVGRKFLIGDSNGSSAAKLDKEQPSEVTIDLPDIFPDTDVHTVDPPKELNFATGNTCLVGQVTDKDSIEKLP